MSTAEGSREVDEMLEASVRLPSIPGTGEAVSKVGKDLFLIVLGARLPFKLELLLNLNSPSD